MVSFGLLTALLLVASATDMRRGKIYNWTTYSGMLAALILNAAGSWWEFGQNRSDCCIEIAISYGYEGGSHHYT